MLVVRPEGVRASYGMAQRLRTQAGVTDVRYSLDL